MHSTHYLVLVEWLGTLLDGCEPSGGPPTSSRAIGISPWGDNLRRDCQSLSNIEYTVGISCALFCSYQTSANKTSSKYMHSTVRAAPEL